MKNNRAKRVRETDRNIKLKPQIGWDTRLNNDKATAG